MRRLVCILLLAAAICGFSISGAQAASTKDFLNEQVLAPHHSVIDGADMVECWRIYNIPVLDMLVILGAETSLGDPVLGGRLVGENNFGCIRAFSGWEKTKWGEWADGTVIIRGVQWLTWPSPAVGLYAWCRYVRTGAHSVYPAMLERGDWEAFSAVYYGANIPGIAAYTANLYALESRFRARALAAGFLW